MGQPANGSEFVFPTRNGTPRKHRTQLLELCKAVAERAELSADDFWLHKFRATFATHMLQRGVDIRTVQELMGHTNIQTTMRYLAVTDERLVAAVALLG